MGMLFSIVIPAHNGEKYLRLSIESALNQERKADEIIVVDDASTDGTAQVAQSPQYNNGVKYFYNKESTGFVDAWNRSIKKASGDLVTILHQDDLLHPQYLKHIEKALIKYPKVKHIYSACNYIDERGNIIGMPPQPHSIEPVLYTGKTYAHNYLMGVLSNRHIHRCPGVTTSRELLLNKCTYRKEAGHIADDDFFLRVGAFTDVLGISEPLASYRHHEDSTTSRVDLLTLTLAEDYMFQLRYYEENIIFLDSSDIMKLNRQAVKFINLLLFQSYLCKRMDWAIKALNLRMEIEKRLPSFFMKNVPVWARQMWRMTSPTGERNRMATIYVKSLNNSIMLRDLIRSFFNDK